MSDHYVVLDDDRMVDLIAEAMKAKLAKCREQGRNGWHDPDLCPPQVLRDGLRSHLMKGDPLDVANYAAFLYARDLSTVGQPELDADRELRILRAYQWTLVLNYRGHARRYEALPGYTAYGRSKDYNMKANRALRAVQALNCVLTGTAEQDLAEMGEVTW